MMKMMKMMKKPIRKKKISNELLIVIIVIGFVLVFSIIGLVLWKKILERRRKIKENELIDRLDFY